VIDLYSSLDSGTATVTGNRGIVTAVIGKILTQK